MHRILIALTLIYGVLSLSAEASTPHVAHPRVVSRSKRAAIQRKSKIQQHYSFIPEKKPLESIERLNATPLTGHVVQQSMNPVIATPPSGLPWLHSPITDPSIAIPSPVTGAKQQRGIKTAAPSYQRMGPIGPLALATWTRQRMLKHQAPGIKIRSWISPLNEAQARQLAAVIAAFLIDEFPASPTTLLLAPPTKGQQHNPLTSALVAELQVAGFHLVPSLQQNPQAVVLRYQVSRLDNGLWLQIQLPDKEANRFFAFNPNHQLLATSPFSIRISSQKEE